VISFSEATLHFSKPLTHSGIADYRLDKIAISRFSALTDQELQEGCVKEGDFVVSAFEVQVNCQCLADDVREQVVDLLTQNRVLLRQRLYEVCLKIHYYITYKMLLVFY
jgi:hypothetical protein